MYKKSIDEVISADLQGRAKNLGKFSDTCSVRADGLCIGRFGSSKLVGRRKQGNSNMQEFFYTTQDESESH